MLGTVPDIVVVPACTPMEIGKIVKEDKIVLEDDSGDVAFPICGDWRKWVRATRKECRDLAASQSVSFRLNKSLRASKYCYVVVTEDHAVTPAPGAPPP